MKRFALYSAYREMDERQINFLRGEALLNAKYAIGIDVLFLRVSVAKDKSCLHFIYVQVISFCKDFAWYLRMLCRGNIILPVPFLSKFLYLVPSFFKTRLLPSSGKVSELYYKAWPSTLDYEDVIATYIRYVARPNERYGLEPYDHRFLLMLQAWNNYKQVLNCVFSIFKPSAYFSLYCGYLTWQSPINIAIARKIPVMVSGLDDRLFSVSDSQSPKQVILNRDYKHYKYDVDCLPTSEELVRTGTRILNQRLAGRIDSGTYYMKQSAYQRSAAASFWQIKNINQYCKHVDHYDLKGMDQGFVVVFMHEFSDYHHYGVLPSFCSSYYDWFRSTIICLERSSVPYLVKIHPQIMNFPEQYVQTVQSLSDYCQSLSFKLPVLSGNVTTVDLVDFGLSLGVTIRGTVALELAYMRIPFICSGNPPFAHLFPSRIESNQSLYFERLKRYWLEPAVTEKESEAAAYYVAESEYLKEIPEIDLNGSHMVEFSPVELYLQSKRWF